MGVLIFILCLFSAGFVAGQAAVKNRIKFIKEKIPQKWWHGGWDEESDLNDLLSPSHTDKHQKAQAQYLLASQHYANRYHQRALQGYRKLINDYPNAWFECQKAQFEIGQIHLYRLQEFSTAIYAYQKVIDDYPDNYLKAMAQMMKARAYREQKDYGRAFIEYEEVIKKYPKYRTEVTEASIDMGDLFISKALNAQAQPEQRNTDLDEALLSYKRAYNFCPVNHPELMERTLDGIYRSFRCRDMNLVRATQFIKFQKYGIAGIDQQEGTDDDLINPLEEIQL